jgi:hypothetical protein
MEKWKPIKNFEGWYEVSNHGRVRSVTRDMTQKGNGGSEFTYTREGKYLKPTLTNKGYLKVMLNIHSKKYQFSVHRIVAEHFVPNPYDKPQVNHRDTNKLNNYEWNLEWVTNAENMEHAIQNDLIKTTFGEQRSNAKLTENDVRYIKTHYEKGRGKMNSNYFAKRYGVHKTTIQQIINGKKWKHIQVEGVTTIENTPTGGSE